MPDNAYKNYLHFLISTRRLPEAKKVWDKYAEKGEVPVDIFLRFTSFLIKENDLRSAKAIWADRFGNWEGVWNGDFEKVLINSGFDWRINDSGGVKISFGEKIKDRGNAVRVEFNGSSNIEFYNLRQIIPTEGNTEYELSAWMKSIGLPTKNGVFWEAYCPGSKELYAKSEEVHGTTDWHKVSVTFETPNDCDLLRIGLRRHESDRIYGNMKGTVWIDDVSLKKTK